MAHLVKSQRQRKLRERLLDEIVKRKRERKSDLEKQKLREKGETEKKKKR